jgi:gas vesicle protein GvpL/GvpF
VPATIHNVMQTGTYVYCVIAADRRPALRRRFRRPPGMGPVRLLDIDRGLWLVVADAPLDEYGEDSINQKLSDIDWVSRAAVAHEAVVESFIPLRAVLPMKLFTIFTTDERALDQVRGDRERIDRLVKRVANQTEWGVRVTLGRVTAARAAAPASRRKVSTRPGTNAGAGYLSQKKAQRDAALELAARARDTVAGLYDRLESKSRLAKRRAASELPADRGPLLLDAAFLVPRARATSFRTLVSGEAKRLGRLGYAVSLSGPWPPYTFVAE